jgi:hypothetical protein
VAGGEKVRESEQQDVVEELGVEALHCVWVCAGAGAGSATFEFDEKNKSCINAHELGAHAR